MLAQSVVVFISCVIVDSLILFYIVLCTNVMEILVFCEFHFGTVQLSAVRGGFECLLRLSLYLCVLILTIFFRLLQ